MLVLCVVGTEVGQKVTPKCGNRRKVIYHSNVSGNCITTPVVCDATSVKQKRKSVESISASSLNLN